ncbi:peptidase S8/S53 subtilisin kexin sedolisin [Bradyrhizobium iriomotense]|uniref:peptidase S8/S53 subtilisin kexin sedolisin n=1 Tax=Bradyrhizobium iriomotense TaxID=441950 RepID=UPI001B8A14DC|nr:peptidase S8/S53 subtilisin kexin sedolisin [Bradyrhizobium iriomotense]MBR1129183.1 peptidase S8/S53 subtilisin kexin sedolisin [Bradyrhizobium iriomotense]
MPIVGTGWELHLKRLGMHKSGPRQRTYGSYQVYIDGQAQPGLAGFICERLGPGNNVTAGNGKRIEAKTYPLWTQFGQYRSIGYSTDQEVAGKPPMPAILLLGTGARTGILIHPAHPPNLYLSSIGCLNPTSAVGPADLIDFWDSHRRVIALLESLKTYAPTAFAHEVTSRIKDASIVIDGEPTEQLTATPVAALAAVSAETALLLPISKASALICARWLMDNFGDRITNACTDKIYKPKHLCAIVCQETAYKWIPWIGTQSVQTIVERAVFDASGDYPGTSRGPFPKNTAAFRDKYGDSFADLLIEEANKTRRLQGWGDKSWVYKGYGLFQYDLQHVKTAEGFFKNREWYSFDNCLSRVVEELDDKLAAQGGDLWKAIKAYNGSGPAAEKYMQNVKAFTEYCEEVTGA